MRTKPPYTPVKFYTDDPWPDLEPGHYVTTSGGSAYLVQGVRKSKKLPNRTHWNGVRWPREEIPAGATVHKITWYPRKSRTLARRPKFSPILPPAP